MRIPGGSSGGGALINGITHLMRGVVAAAATAPAALFEVVQGRALGRRRGVIVGMRLGILR